MPTPNPEQAAAVAHRGTAVVLSAGAGCGKTSVLVERYLSHLDRDGAAVAEVTAITFTEKAAREMRGRIRAAVDAVPGPAWAAHRRDLDAAPIDTIHGYCGRLLRRFPGSLPADFQVFDEPQAAGLRADAVRAELQRLLTATGKLGDDLRELAVLFGWAATLEAVEGLLDAPERAGWQRWAASDPVTGWRARQSELLPRWLAYQSAAGGKLAVALRTLSALTVPPGPGADRVCAVLDAFADPSGKGLAGLNDTAKVQGLKKGWADPDTAAAVKDAFEAVRESLKGFAELTADADGWDTAAEVGKRFLRVATAADAAYTRAKRAAGGLDFHDLLVLAHRLLTTDATARAKVQAGTRFLLVDEFQDTDPLQLEIVRLVADDDAGKLFVVGDRKQSIYRFRGADVSLFERLEGELGSLPLSTNYRSRREVVGFVNALFGRRLPGYVPLVPHHGDGGAVEFLWAVPHAPDTKATADSLRAREADAVARRVAELVADGTPAGDIAVLFRAMSNVATYEAALRRHGLDYYVVGGRAFFAQQEVFDLHNLLAAVENPHDGPALAGYLRSPAGGLPDDALHLLAGGDGIWANLHSDSRLSPLGDDRPAAERARGHLTAWRALKDRLPVAELLDRVFADTGFDAATQFEPLADRKLANLWKLTAQARGFDRDGFGLADFVRWLSGSVADQPREEQAATVPEKAAEVVQLLSIHKSKGLQFPVVIVPDLGATTAGDRHPVARWHRELGCLVRHPADLSEDDGDEPPFPDGPHRLGRATDELADWQESLRVLYVAATRAERRLILSAGLTAEPTSPAAGLPPVPPSKATSPWLLLLSEQYHLLIGACLAGDGPAASVRVVRPGGERSAPPREAKPPPAPLPLAAVPVRLPPVVSLGALRAFAAGEAVATLVTDPPPTTWGRLVRAVLAGWDFADRDGWRPVLAAALAADPAADPLRDDAVGVFERFAADGLDALVDHGDVRRGAELLFEPAAVAGDAGWPFPEVAFAGRIELLTKDADGLHMWAVQTTDWADARPWLSLLAAAVRAATRQPVRSVGLFDLAGGSVRTADARKLGTAAGLEAAVAALKRWAE